MTTHRTRLSLLLVLTLGVGLLAALPASAEDTETRAFGCFYDEVGEPELDGTPAADLTEVCANHGISNRIIIIVETAGGIDPLDDPAWANDETALAVGLSVDGDATADYVASVTQDQAGTPPETRILVPLDDGGIGEVDPSACDFDTVPAGEGVIGIRIDRECIGDPDGVRLAARLTYEVDPGGAVAMDQLPDEGFSTPALPNGDEPPVCDNALEGAQEGVDLIRLRCGGVITGTEPISQAVAISQFAFDNLSTQVIDPYLATHAVIARDDNFADALAGSSLGFGLGPLLFTYSPTSGPAQGQDPGRLADITRAELLRSVPRGYPVYILGGTAAISDGVEQQIRDLGYQVTRFAGVSRYQTAAMVAREVRARTQAFAASNDGSGGTPLFDDLNMVFIANAGNWPDAVMAGQIGALWGTPILLTDAGSLHPETAAVLEEIKPYMVGIAGGTGVVSHGVYTDLLARGQAGGWGMGDPSENSQTNDENEPWRYFCRTRNEDNSDAGGFTHICRFGGATRVDTGAVMLQVARTLIDRFGGPGTFMPDSNLYASVVQVGGPVESNTYTHVLASSMFSGRFGGAVMMPVDGQALQDVVKTAVCFLGRGRDTDNDGFLDTPFIQDLELATMMGDTDILSDELFNQVVRLVSGDGCEGFTGEEFGPFPA